MIREFIEAASALFSIALFICAALILAGILRGAI